MNSTFMLSFLGALAGIMVTFVVVLWKRRTSTRGLMRALAAMAVSRAKADYGIELDYSGESVERVEEILARLYANRDAIDLRRESFTWGAYIGEVLVKTKAGRWKRDHEVVGAASYPVHWGNGESFPIGWCQKRLTNGEEDNVWVKYRLLIEEGRGFKQVEI